MMVIIVIILTSMDIMMAAWTSAARVKHRKTDMLVHLIIIPHMHSALGRIRPGRGADGDFY